MEDNIVEVIDYKVFMSPPGFLLHWIDNNSRFYGAEPVIGWILERRRSYDGSKFFWTHQPIVATKGAASSDWRGYCIQLPDGRIHDPCLGTYEDINAYYQAKDQGGGRSRR